MRKLIMAVLLAVVAVSGISGCKTAGGGASSGCNCGR